jgi:hypothetical protein
MRLNGSAIAMHPANKQASPHAATSYLTITVHTAFGARKFGVFPHNDLISLNEATS